MSLLRESERPFLQTGCGVQVIQNVPVPMRDGVSLSADVYLPDSGGPAPALLLRTPYGKRIAEFEGYAHPSWYARHGFAVVCQDVRGCFASEGVFRPFFGEAADGYDTIEWVAAQPWCSGRVGTYGFSYPGATQMLAATEAPPHLTAMAPAMTGSNYHDGWTYRGGALQLAFALGWAALLARHQALRAGDLPAVAQLDGMLANPAPLYARLPVANSDTDALARYAPFLADWLEHPTYDGYWMAASPKEHYDAIEVPGLHVAGWYDIFLEGAIENYRALTDAGRARQCLLVGPWYHMPWMAYIEGVDFGAEAASVVDEVQLRFFRETLLGEAPQDEPPVRLFVMGLNRWRSYQDWPPRPQREWRLFLRSDGRANSVNGVGTLAGAGPPDGEPPDFWASEPVLPVLSLGGRSCCAADTAPMGPADQRSQEARNDVLVYTSEVLETDATVIGVPVVRLYLACDSPTSDIMLRLVDVYPDGRALNVSDGVVRLEWQHTSEVKELVVEMSPTAIAFSAGHRIRLDVTATSFPMYDRNPGSTVMPASATAADYQVVTQVLFHDATRASHLILPLVT